MRIAMFGQKRIPSREGGVEIVVEELSIRMAELGHKVTCYNRKGHHVSGSQYDTFIGKEYKNVRIKTVPTIEKKGLAAVVIIFCSTLQLIWKVRCGSYTCRRTSGVLLYT